MSAERSNYRKAPYTMFFVRVSSNEDVRTTDYERAIFWSSLRAVLPEDGKGIELQFVGPKDEDLPKYVEANAERKQLHMDELKRKALKEEMRIRIQNRRLMPHR